MAVTRGYLLVGSAPRNATLTIDGSPRLLQFELQPLLFITFHPFCPPQAIASMKPGDVAIIFTPDDSHFSLAAACINAGLHVLVAKPIVKTLSEHKQLVDLARKQNVLVRGPQGLATVLGGMGMLG